MGPNLKDRNLVGATLVNYFRIMYSILEKSTDSFSIIKHVEQFHYMRSSNVTM